ncbi:chromate efflux transporter [Halalkalicoccus jeotgali]|uniref:Chromate transport protein n=1 Tax=Halalkalicoccus jeotgali (strain DSM 18796 / CECT 7217 / JCM 14584 / KCTC 4019 / B3) TaxID=795797 RepID=D8J7A4_HALJB|nr:chromate efflux transporter [Halalkalicoccus jeotgali]ADJ13999.1 chromate transport protein [Halalkalicoccus jeotgali B3]ELY33956.1 chromate transport protein [Halalkalicoccus jeotgali B3]
MRGATTDHTGVDSYGGKPTRSKLLEIARYFLFIGVVGFGGPLVHIAMMEDDLVGEDSKEWSDEAVFMEGLAICNMLPGPASTQLGIVMGWLRAGTPGALVAGFCFMLPTFLIVVSFSWLYFAYQQVPEVQALFYGINPVVIGLIAGAAWSMARRALADGREHVAFSVLGEEWSVDGLLLAVLAAAVVATALGANPVVQFLFAGVFAVLVYRSAWVRENRRQASLWALVGGIAGLVYALRKRAFDLLGPSARAALEASPVWGVVLALWSNPWIQLFAFMVYTGAFIYGGGLVLIPFIELYVVGEFGWLSAREFVDGIAIGQLSPGPVVMTTAFVGYKLMLDVSGGAVPIAVLGALVATVGAFGPSFAFILGLFPYFARVRENEGVRTALIGVNAAVVGAILGATVTLATESFVDPFTVALAVATFGLFHRGVHAAPLIVGGGALGMAWYFLAP